MLVSEDHNFTYYLVSPVRYIQYWQIVCDHTDVLHTHAQYAPMWFPTRVSVTHLHCKHTMCPGWIAQTGALESIFVMLCYAIRCFDLICRIPLITLIYVGLGVGQFLVLIPLGTNVGYSCHQFSLCIPPCAPTCRHPDRYAHNVVM